ncbi:hypothetical protein L914_17877 [Phytophthora nicotianae]|uniref:Uncharacterized protein n=4 Tax=Phytophthora nicotianae TaxID=4792 RepID=V9E9V0_PHYNI|nr:hypothetical protein F443_18576 [Phytophthora nicotianae P1569]ETM35180.1 hypothetical protein L914_17877 [Phytophthora nicotianae]
MKTPGSSSPVLAKAFAKDEKVPVSMEVPTYENSKSETESKQSTGSSDCGDTDTESSGGRESEDNQVTIAGGRGGEDADTKSDGEYQSGNACSDEDDTLKAQAPPIEVSDTKLDRRRS